MRFALFTVVAASALSLPCLAQEWELGATGGYGWNSNPSIVAPVGSIQSGFTSRGVMGVVFGQNMYEHVGGEVRWLYQFGGPELRFQGQQVNATGHSNLITYDLLFHLTNREARIRPFLAGGAGVKIFTGNQLRAVGLPGVGSAVLIPCTQVEPAISVGGGLKYRVAKHGLLRLDFRTYMSPLPDRILRPIGLAQVHGWVYNFVPLGGISYVF
jgi:hypothetical protein